MQRKKRTALLIPMLASMVAAGRLPPAFHCATRIFEGSSSSMMSTILPTRLPQQRASIARGMASSGSESSPTTAFWRSREECWRPDVRDVEKISWGKPAKKKGTGSRGVPHRLNQDEREAFDRARRKGFLEVSGSAWRSQRRDAPLINTHRSLSDARARPAVVLHKQRSGTDELVVDLSPLRLQDEFAVVAEECKKRCVDRWGVGEEVSVLAEDDEDGDEESEDGEEDMEGADEEEKAWNTRPLYQLPPYCISWELPRQEAKALGKELAEMFDTIEKKDVSSSKKPKGVKAGKGRRSGGYGIG